MLGKVIAHGRDRETARRALVAALDDTAILGLTTNAGFLRALVASDEFRDATIDTAWLDHRDGPGRRDCPDLAPGRGDARGRRDGAPVRADGWRRGPTPPPTAVELDGPSQSTAPRIVEVDASTSR